MSGCLRATAGALGVASVAVALAGCAGSSSTVSIPDRQLTFPVLWAGTNPDGTRAAGIEPATIAVGTQGDPGFSVNLDDVRAKQAGPAWQAATASAATVGTLLTGTDQSVVDLRYDITGAIDGPSGGAALTVGTMAAITGHAVRPEVAMTGTVAPDGTVGAVSQVPAKVRAAKKAGYTTVLVPIANRTEFDPATGTTVNLPALGRRLGIQVRVVRDVGDAYRVFTGRTIFSPPAATPMLTPRARQVAARTTRAAVRAVRRELGAATNLIPAAHQPGLDAAIARAESALAAGRTALAYGLAVQATYRVKRATARGASRALAAASGVDAARAALRDEVRTLLDGATREFAAQADPSALDLGQRLALPMALGWYSYSIAVLRALEQGLGQDSAWGAAQVQAAAAVVGDVEASVLRFGPDAVAMVRASPSSEQSQVDDQRAAEFLSGYTNFLVSAGNAARDYFVTVDFGTPGAGGGPADIAPVLNQMATIAAATPAGRDPLAEEIVQAADAGTYYVLGATVVSGRSFGMRGFGLGENPGPVGAPTLLANSVAQASATVEWAAAVIQPKGINPSYALWQRQWADAVYAANAGTPAGPSAGTIALNELWYAGLGVMLANSAVRNLISAG